jgi:hypothetical protein
MVRQKLAHRLLDDGLNRHTADDSGKLQLPVGCLGNPYAELGLGLRLLRCQQIGLDCWPRAVSARI